MEDILKMEHVHEPTPAQLFQMTKCQPCKFDKSATNYAPKQSAFTAASDYDGTMTQGQHATHWSNMTKLLEK